jgi:hypothetical protein
MSFRKLAPIAAVALALTLGPAEAAPAQSATSLAQSALRADAGTAVTEVGWRHRRHRWRRGGGALLGLGAGIVIGSIIANESYRSRRGYYYDDYAYDGPYNGGDPRVACAERFRSFYWDTGLYTLYSGERRLCPYLR